MLKVSLQIAFTNQLLDTWEIKNLRVFRRLINNREEAISINYYLFPVAPTTLQDSGFLHKGNRNRQGQGAERLRHPAEIGLYRPISNARGSEARYVHSTSIQLCVDEVRGRGKGRETNHHELCSTAAQPSTSPYYGVSFPPSSLRQRQRPRRFFPFSTFLQYQHQNCLVPCLESSAVLFRCRLIGQSTR